LKTKALRKKGAKGEPNSTLSHRGYNAPIRGRNC